MKKGIVILVIIVAAIAGGLHFLAGNAGALIKEQIEIQGSKFLGTSVAVDEVALAISDGKLGINGLTVKNPTGFSDANAFSLAGIMVDLGNIAGEPYTLETFAINAPEVLYEVDAKGNGNLIVLKQNLSKNLPQSEPTEPKPEGSANPLVIIDDVQISKVKLKLNFENLDTGDYELPVEQRAYEIELPTFSAGAIGQPNGLPADQVGAVIVDKMLDNIIAQAKKEAKKRIAEAAKEKAKEKIEEKAKGVLKDIFG